jgi:hypothetical protein
MYPFYPAIPAFNVVFTRKIYFYFFTTTKMSDNAAALNVNIRKFDMKMIPQDAVVVFIGRRRTGKSTLVRDLLFHHQDMPLGTVISGTEESNDFYKKIIPPLFIHGEYSPVIIANFCKRQKIIMQKVMMETKERGQSRLDPRSFLIMDDCLYDDSWLHDRNIRYLFLNGRWLKVFFLITMQYPLRAEIHGEFRIGAQEFWNHSAANYKPKNIEEGDDYDPIASKKLRGPLIQVKKFS